MIDTNNYFDMFYCDKDPINAQESYEYFMQFSKN